MGIRNAKNEAQAKTQLALPKAGNRVGILTGIIDVGIHKKEFKGEPKPPCREFVPLYTLVSDKYEDDEGNVKHIRISPYPLKLLPGSSLAKYKGWYKAHDPENKVLDKDGAGDITQLIGTPVNIKPDHTEPNDEGLIYANMFVENVAGLPDDYPVPDVDYDVVIFDTEEPDKDIFDSLGTWTQDYIRNSEGYAGSNLEAILDGGAAKADGAKEEEQEEEEDSPI